MSDPAIGKSEREAALKALIRDTIAAQGGRLSVSSLSDGAQAEIRLSRG